MTDKQSVTPDQFVTAITTSWGGTEEGIARSWATTNLTYEIGTFAGEVEDGSSDAAGYTPMTVNQANSVTAAFDESESDRQCDIHAIRRGHFGGSLRSRRYHHRL